MKLGRVFGSGLGSFLKCHPNLDIAGDLKERAGSILRIGFNEDGMVVTRHSDGRDAVNPIEIARCHGVLW